MGGGNANLRPFVWYGSMDNEHMGLFDKIKLPSANHYPLTPVVLAGGYYLKREDLYTEGAVNGGKLRSARALVAANPTCPGYVAYGGRTTTSAPAIAVAAREAGKPCIFYTPAGEDTPELKATVAAGAEVIRVKPGYTSVLKARAVEHATQLGYLVASWGLQSPSGIAATSGQVANLPFGKFKRLVVPVGAGTALCAILNGLVPRNQFGKFPITAILMGGEGVKEALGRYAPPGWERFVELRPSGVDYATPATVTHLGNVELDPYYSAKCIPHLEKGDLLWVVGRRPGMQTPPGSARVYWHTSEDMSEVKNGSVRLLLNGGLYLGKGVGWDKYEALYRRVLVKEGHRILQPDGYLVCQTTDAFIKGEVLHRSGRLVSFLCGNGYRLLDTKIWERMGMNLFQPPFSHILVFGRPGGASRTTLKHRPYLDGVWRYPQTAGGALGAWPDPLCALLVQTFTRPGDTIADAFTGTGRLLGVAASLDRHAIGYEIDESLRETVEGHIKGYAPPRARLKLKGNDV